MKIKKINNLSDKKKFIFFDLFRKIKLSESRGFTLVEMAVVSAIFAIITAVILFRYGDFNSNILVTNMAYEVALTTRQAQVFGLSARGFDAEGTTEFQFPYGVFFNLNDGSTGNPQETKKFTFFVDRNEETEPGYGQCNTASGAGDCVCADGDECIEQLTMQRDIKITEARVGSSASTCSDDNIYKLAITFQRPSPEARIEWQNSGISGYDFAQIKIESNSGNTNPAYVLIRQNGQISVSDEDVCFQ